MLDWIRKFLPRPETAKPPTPDQALTRLQMLISDAAIEDVWEGLDWHGEQLEPRVRELVDHESMGEYPMHAAILWLCYRQGLRDEVVAARRVAQLRKSIEWALRFEENQVLIGGALGALEAISPEEQTGVALDVFSALGKESARRYWLLLKVRSDAFVAEVARALEEYAPAQRPRMAGAFRQMSPDDVDVILKHHDLQSRGAAMFVEALAATGAEEALPALREALADVRPDVRDAARRGIIAAGGCVD